MKRNLRALGALASIAVAATTFVSQAQAMPVLSLVLSPVTDVAFGGAVGVDIVVNGLTEAVGGFGFDLSYDISRMSYTALSFLEDPDTKMGDGGSKSAFAFGTGNGSGVVNFGVLAGYVLASDEAPLKALQGGGFKLGHVEFTALNNAGFAAFGLSGFSLSKYDGITAIQGVTARGAQLCVSPAGTPVPCGNNVPEPTSPLLVAAALAGLALTRRQAKAASRS